MDIATFLSSGQRNPEHQALLHLLGTLLKGESAATPKRSCRAPA
jgi:hypothetical protein